MNLNFTILIKTWNSISYFWRHSKPFNAVLFYCGGWGCEDHPHTPETHGPETARAQRKNEIPFTLQEAKGRNLNLSNGETEALFQKEPRPCHQVNSLSFQELHLDGSQTVHPAPSNDLWLIFWSTSSELLQCSWFSASPLAKRSSGANGILGMKRKEAGQMFRGHHEADVTHHCPVHLRYTQRS